MRYLVRNERLHMALHVEGKLLAPRYGVGRDQSLWLSEEQWKSERVQSLVASKQLSLIRTEGGAPTLATVVVVTPPMPPSEEVMEEPTPAPSVEEPTMPVIEAPVEAEEEEDSEDKFPAKETWTEETLRARSYRDNQALARHYGVPAGGSEAAIVARLLALIGSEKEEA